MAVGGGLRCLRPSASRHAVGGVLAGVAFFSLVDGKRAEKYFLWIISNCGINPVDITSYCRWCLIGLFVCRSRNPPPPPATGGTAGTGWRGGWRWPTRSRRSGTWPRSCGRRGSDDELVEVVWLVQQATSALAAVEAGAVVEADTRNLAQNRLGYGSTGDWVTHLAGLRARRLSRGVDGSGRAANCSAAISSRSSREEDEITRTSTWTSLSPPTRRKRCSTRTRRMRLWVSRGMSAYLVEIEGAAVGAFEHTDLARTTVLALLAKQLDVQALGRHARALTATNSLWRAAAGAMDQPGHQLLAGTGRTRDQHPAVGRRDLGDQSGAGPGPPPTCRSGRPA